MQHDVHTLPENAKRASGIFGKWGVTFKETKHRALCMIMLFEAWQSWVIIARSQNDPKHISDFSSNPQTL